MKLTLLILVVLCSGIFCIKPVCFNCHCSTLSLDNNLRCSEAILNKSTTYFSRRTRNVTALYGSDIMLGIVMKERAEHCWCTDSHLEWNLQDVEFWNDTKLLIVTIQNVSIVASGHYWAVLEHSKLFYFSEPIYLNISGAIVPTPSPPLDADPKMSALVVGILVLVILVSGILIYCWNMVVRKRREKKRRVYEQMEDIQELPLNYYTELEQMSSVIDHITGLEEEEEEVVTKVEEEGSVDKEGDETLSVSSHDDRIEPPVDAAKLSKENKPLKTVMPTTHHSLPAHPPFFSPNTLTTNITDDRFQNQRSWYKSLDVEISSGPLLKDPERAEKVAEKKRQKELSKNSMQNVASGLLGSGMVCSGLMGNFGPAAQESVLEDLRRYYNTLNGLKYGRSLPTPIPAGARPTVMTLFANTGPGNSISKTATIHTSRPVPRHRAQSLFNGMEERNRSVTFCDKISSSNGVLSENKKKKRKKESCSKAPKKSSLKPQADGQIFDKKSDESTSSSDSDEHLEIPQLNLIPSSPLGSPITPNEHLKIPQLNLIPSSPAGLPITPSPSAGRFTVVRVPSPTKQNEEGSVNSPTKHNGEVTIDGTEVIGS